VDRLEEQVHLKLLDVRLIVARRHPPLSRRARPA
jgi:hypothetical protein